MHRTTSNHRRLETWFVLVALVALAACTPPITPAPEPSVTSFIATPESLSAGESAVLSWVVEDATSVMVTTAAGDTVVESDEADGSVDVVVLGTTTYLLTATGPGGVAEAEVTVTVAVAELVGNAYSTTNVVVGTALDLAADVSGGVGAYAFALAEGSDLPVGVTLDADTGAIAGTPTEIGLVAGTVVVTDEADQTANLAYSIDVTPVPGPDVLVGNAYPPDTVVVGTALDLAADVSGGEGAYAFALADGSALPVGVMLDADTGSIAGTPTAVGSFTGSVVVTDEADQTANLAYDITVIAADSAPVVVSFTATVVEGSQLELEWNVANATDYEVFTVLAGDPSDTMLLVASTTATSATVAIPVADRQLVRLIATGPGGVATEERTPLNVVTNGLDYDVYDGDWWTPDPEPVVPGSLRAVVAAAEDGAIIGFAADVTDVALYGVDIFDPKTDAAYGPAAPGTATVDAHLTLLRDVTISGPIGTPVTIRSEVHPDSTDIDGFTWRSRVLFVARGRTVALSNVRIADGTFIFVGAGVRNDGTLAMTDVLVENNRAWQFGGGIANVGGALTLQRVTMRNNLAATLDDEVGEIFRIRENTIQPIGSAPVADLTSTDDGYGGGLANVVGPGGVSGTVTVIDSLVDLNEAKLWGGGTYSTTGTIAFTDTDVTSNRANVEGYAPRTDGILSYGGGVVSNAVFSMTGGDVTGNHATNIGGGFANFTSGTASLTDVVFDLNTAEFYGCISNAADPSDVVLTNVTCTSTNSGTPPIQEGGIVGPSAFRVPASVPNPSGASFR